MKWVSTRHASADEHRQIFDWPYGLSMLSTLTATIYY